MLNGHLGFENIFAVASGAVMIMIGIAHLRWRVAFDRVSEEARRRMAPSRLRFATNSPPWAGVVVGVGFICIGVLAIWVGLFVELMSSG